MFEHDSILRAILDEPQEDSHRLVYADWLEDQGQSRRAEFIRDSIRTPQCSHLALTRDDPFPLLGLEPGAPVLVGGGPTGQGDLRTWMWSETDALGLVIHDLGRGLAYWVDRGFILGLMGGLAYFLRHAKLLFALHPIEKVCLSDKSPTPNADPPNYSWRARLQSPYFSLRDYYVIPDDIHGWMVAPRNRKDYWTHYPTQEAAYADLSRACVLYGRRLAGLSLLLEQL